MYDHAAWCRNDVTADTIHELLRCQVSEIRRQHENPRGAEPGSQTVRASTNAPKETAGLDPGQKILCRGGAPPPMFLV
ncbi:hypothetical protein [Streptomyces sp. AK02-04a]|uniref:hypothetical protein n=1 Tax=Streptomyces sp. AK02-04a TaxID=3028649 RepID=UPI0029A60BB0|nr:hypothetical protein [Streptomyces sp. AK02-04a]MDX3762796.1 hypothetical protein [Streptomyces sp. AK02-04a]